MPQRPSTTLGIAASSSTSMPIGPRTRFGASSLRNRPIAIDTGAATISAEMDVKSVPKMKAPRAELVRDDAPGVRRDEPEAELLHRRPRALEDAVDDQADEDDRSERGEARDHLHGNVSDAVAQRRRPEPLRVGCGAEGDSIRTSIAPAGWRTVACHQNDTDPSHHCDPGAETSRGHWRRCT